jgi:DNA-binding NtrC family response regulator
MHAYRKEFLGQQVRHFIPVNLAALPKELVERELFGNDVGAFTGAVRLKQGFVELANKGTLFLDEIGECPLDVQAKLLTVLNNGKYFRIGGNTELHSSFKLICATNRDLEQMVKDGTFREDLWMRISTFQVKIPALHERPEDIPEITKAIFARCCAENNVDVTFESLPLELIEYLVENPPPGNIRGIDNLLSRLLVWSPRGKDGKPILSRWRSTLGLYKVQHLKPERNSISIKELMTLPIDIYTPDFPGLAPFISALTDRIVLSAKLRLETNRDVARLLKLSESGVSQKLKMLTGKPDVQSISSSALGDTALTEASS